MGTPRAYGRGAAQLDNAMVTNLVLNAVDVLPTVGALSLRVAAVEDPSRRAVGLLGHDLVHQPREGCFARAWLAAPKDVGAVHVPRRQVLERTTMTVLVLDAGGPMWTGAVEARSLCRSWLSRVGGRVGSRR